MKLTLVLSLALVTTRLILVLGVEVSRELPDGVVRAAGLVSMTSPSTTWTGDHRKPQHVVGVVLGEVVLDRKGPETVSTPIPTAAEVARVKTALARLRVEGEPRVFAVLQDAGGK